MWWKITDESGYEIGSANAVSAETAIAKIRTAWGKRLLGVRLFAWAENSLTPVAPDRAEARDGDGAGDTRAAADV